MAISLAEPKSKDNPKGLAIDTEDFKVTNTFSVLAILICGILAAIYTVFIKILSFSVFDDFLNKKTGFEVIESPFLLERIVFSYY